jgi:ferredoxin
MEGRQQYLLLAELCNECGDCMVFCPEIGDPAQIKPKLYRDWDRFLASEGQGFYLTGIGEGLGIMAKPGFETEIPRLATILSAAEGLPIPVPFG